MLLELQTMHKKDDFSSCATPTWSSLLANVNARGNWSYIQIAVCTQLYRPVKQFPPLPFQQCFISVDDATIYTAGSDHAFLYLWGRNHGTAHLLILAIFDMTYQSFLSSQKYTSIVCRIYVACLYTPSGGETKKLCLIKYNHPDECFIALLNQP